VLAVGAAARSINQQISDFLTRHPPSAVDVLLVLVFLVPILDLCAAAWARLAPAGLVESPMANTPHITSAQVAAAAERDMLIFPTKAGGIAERNL
jgi:hypothetical protein